MPEPHDRLDIAPPAEDRSPMRRAPYAALAVAGIVTSTIFATVAALASGHADQAQAPQPVSNDPVVVTTSDASGTSIAEATDLSATSSGQATSPTPGVATTTTTSRRRGGVPV